MLRALFVFLFALLFSRRIENPESSTSAAREKDGSIQQNSYPSLFVVGMDLSQVAGAALLRSRLGELPMRNYTVTLFLEELESRDLLSVGVLPADPLLDPAAGHAPFHPPKEAPPTHHPGRSSGGITPLNPNWYTPDQIRSAYGFNQVSLTGAGQTIAIIDVYNDPNIFNDANVFSAQFGLPQLTPQTFIKLNEYGNSNGPFPATNSAWSSEISLDVEWAHAIAPQANIVLVEANSESTSDVFQAMLTAQNYVGVTDSRTGKLDPVTVVSMSWGYNESNRYMQSNMTTYDKNYLSPSRPITFVAATLDNGSRYGVYWPAISPNVVGVGGTVLTLNSSGGYGSETGWSYSTGGISKYEVRPTYQNLVPYGLTALPANRMNPDVSYAATNFAAYDTVGTYHGWFQAGGTSAGTPQWAGLIALVDQGREEIGGQPLNSTQTLQTLYHFAGSQYFHDITSGSNGAYTAGPGYDLVTGIGTPIANNLIPAMIGYVPPASLAASTVSPAAESPDKGSPPLLKGEMTSIEPPSALQFSSNGALLDLLPATEGPTQNVPDNPMSPVDQFWVAYGNWLGNNSFGHRDATTVAGLSARFYLHRADE
jgi:subtilase family serine protease